MRVLIALLAAAVLTTTPAAAHVAAKSPGEDDPGSLPTWSPDGSRLSFARGHDLVVLQLAGGRQRRLPPGGGVWSPDGERLAFLRSQNVYIADADGADARQIGRGDGFSWSPDSRSLVIANTSLAVVGLDGTVLRQLPRPAPCTTCHGRGHVFPQVVAARGLDRVRRRHQSRWSSWQRRGPRDQARRHGRAGGWEHSRPIGDLVVARRTTGSATATLPISRSEPSSSSLVRATAFGVVWSETVTVGRGRRPAAS